MKPILIIQTSPYRTASTLLVNALYGLIPTLSDKRIVGEWEKPPLSEDIQIWKCHELNIDSLIALYENDYNVFFVCSERKQLDKMIDPRYKTYPNVCVFEYRELNETPSYSVPNIIQCIYNKISTMIHIEMNVESGIQRVIEMNKRYEDIKHNPFNYTDSFYQIHGSHRERNKIAQPKQSNPLKNKIRYVNKY